MLLSHSTRQKILPLLVALVGILISIAAARVVEKSESRSLDRYFRLESEGRVHAIEREIGLAIDTARDAKAFFEASDQVRPDEFETFTSASIEETRSLDALEWIPRVTQSDRGAFVARARSEVNPSYEIFDSLNPVTPAALRAEYLPILYLAPKGSHPALLGLDVAADSESLAPFVRAGESGEVTLSAPRHLPYRAGELLTVVAPVYQSASTHLLGAPPRGYIRATFRIDELVNSALADRPFLPAYLSLVDVTGATPVVLKEFPLSPTAESMASNKRATIRFAELFTAADRRWEIRVEGGAQFIATYSSYLAIGVLLIGLVITTLLSSLIWMIETRAVRVQALVAQRTQQLLRANEDLAREMEQRKVAQQEREESIQELERSHLAALNIMEDLHAKATELSVVNDELKRSNKELDDFAYIASHDLKEPLRGIHNFARFLRDDYRSVLDANGSTMLDTLMRLSQRMDGLINALLHYSKVGRLELNTAPCDLNEVLRDVLDSLQVMLKERHVELRFPEPLPILPCDRIRIGELLQNLISNAVKYNTSDHPLVEVGSIQIGRDEGVETAIYVRDNGIGIPEKHRQSIFRLFRRLHGRDQYGGGTGAGLTIAQKIVERHGGHIWVESSDGQGSTFYFTLAAPKEHQGSVLHEQHQDSR